MTLEYKIENIWEVSLIYGGNPGAINSVSPVMTVTKEVWNGETWVSNITAYVGDILRFRINISNTGSGP